MKLLISSLVLGLLVLFSFNFVFAEGSEVSVDFNVGGVVNVQDNISYPSFWDVWGAYIIGLAILLIIIILLSKKKGVKRVSPVKLKKRVVVKKRKAVKKAVKKKRR